MRKLITPLLVAISLLAGCGSEDPDYILLPAAPVYTSGYTTDAADANAKPCYWKNDVRVELNIPDGNTGKALAMDIYNSSIYFTGHQNDGATNTPIYWKNAERNIIPYVTGSTNAIATDIYADTNGVHAVGSYEDGTWKLFYWNNQGSAIELTDSLSAGDARTKIFANDDTYYVAGRSNTPAGAYWTISNAGAVSHQAANFTADDYPLHITVSNDKIYLAGYRDTDAGAGTDFKACYWEDDDGDGNFTPHIITIADADAGNGGAAATFIEFTSSIMYISGRLAKADGTLLPFAYTNATISDPSKGTLTVASDAPYVTVTETFAFLYRSSLAILGGFKDPAGGTNTLPGYWIGGILWDDLDLGDAAKGYTTDMAIN